MITSHSVGDVNNNYICEVDSIAENPPNFVRAMCFKRYLKLHKKQIYISTFFLTILIVKII